MVCVRLTSASDSTAVQLRATAVSLDGSGFRPLLGCKQQAQSPTERAVSAWYSRRCRGAPARPGG